MGEFAGFSVPLWYKGIAEEHTAVRNLVGLFDVAHMGRFGIKGGDATELLAMILTTDPAKVSHGRGFYSVICNEYGGIVDDVVILKFSNDDYIMVCNSSNREKDWSWVSTKASNLDLELENISDTTAMFAIQGPKAESVLQGLIDLPLGSLRRFGHMRGKISKSDVIISRTGYTGEDGFEVIILESSLDNPGKAEDVWNLILSSGEREGIIPCGLGARDTLRLEAGMCLYGFDIDESTTPFEANLGWVVDFEKPMFIGRDALTKQRESGVEKIRMGFTAKTKGVPRTGCDVLKEGKRIGKITSGTYSPLLSKGIAMGYIPKTLAKAGEELRIDVRGNLLDAVITLPPFYDTSKYGWKRTK